MAGRLGPGENRSKTGARLAGLCLMAMENSRTSRKPLQVRGMSRRQNGFARSVRRERFPVQRTSRIDQHKLRLDYCLVWSTSDQPSQKCPENDKDIEPRAPPGQL